MDSMDGKEIREEASATQVHAFASALTEETLKALGFSVSHSEGSIAWISW